MRVTHPASLIRRLNSSAVLDLIRQHSPIARSQIARQLALSLPTVMRITGDLLAENLVRWSGGSQASGGRPRSLLEFNGAGYAVLGLDLGGTKMLGTVADLSGQIQKEIYAPWRKIDPHSCLDQVCELIGELLEAPRPPGQRVRGIGVGAPGITYTNEGLVTWAPSLGWRDLPLRDILQDRFGLPAVVENDVNLAALGEYGFGAGRGAASMVLIAIGTGIGAGIVIDRQIYRGFNQSSGEVGYLPPTPAHLGRPYAGFGALESLASGSGIQRRAAAWFEMQGQNAPPGLDAEMVFNAAREGQVWACQVIEETVDYLAQAVAAVSTVLDPQIVVLGGGVARSADMLIGPILQRLDGVLPVQPHIVQSALGWRATVMGAILLVLDHTTEHILLPSYYP